MSIENITIKPGSIDEVVEVSSQIPEFNMPHQAAEYERRLKNVNHLILISYNKNNPVGFKVGYEREQDGSFYSWMGAVSPDYRQFGIAKRLANYQETWARENGYTKIKMKTRNRLKPMLIFALKNGFMITKVETKPSLEEHRILLEKTL